MIERGADSADVREDAFRDYNARLDDAMTPLIWGGRGAGSYYLNEHGRSGVNMPWTVQEYYACVMEPVLTDFEMRKVVKRPVCRLAIRRYHDDGAPLDHPCFARMADSHRTFAQHGRADVRCGGSFSRGDCRKPAGTWSARSWSSRVRAARAGATGSRLTRLGRPSGRRARPRPASARPLARRDRAARWPGATSPPGSADGVRRRRRG